MDSGELGRGMERSEQRALAIDELLRGELEGRSTEELVAELDRLEAACDDPGTRRAEAITEARLVAERQFGEVARALEASTASRPERVRLEVIHEHAAARLDTLRAEERAAREAAPEPADRERAAAIERVLRERRRLGVEATITLEPAYLTDALGPRPEGLRARLDWERAVDQVERHRQLLGVRDPERAIGAEPWRARELAKWRAAQQELEIARARLIDRGRERGLARAVGQGIER